MKKCTNCKIEKDGKEFWSDISRKDKLSKICKICGRQKRHEYVVKNKYKMRQWWLNNRDKSRGYDRKRWNDPIKRAKRLKQQAVRRIKIKNIVFNYYGGQCIKCNNDLKSMLCMDHINNDGTVQKKLYKLSGGSAIYNWIIKNNYPKDLQILCANCNIIKYREFKLPSNGRHSIRNHKLKYIIFNHYGDKCTCCGFNDKRALVVDHINNDGGEHRRQVGSYTKFYLWLIKNNYPSGYQALCFSCNTSKLLNHGICEHKEILNALQNYSIR